MWAVFLCIRHVLVTQGHCSEWTLAGTTQQVFGGLSSDLRQPRRETTSLSQPAARSQVWGAVLWAPSLLPDPRAWCRGKGVSPRNSRNTGIFWSLLAEKRSCEPLVGMAAERSQPRSPSLWDQCLGPQKSQSSGCGCRPAKASTHSQDPRAWEASGLSACSFHTWA